MAVKKLNKKEVIFCREFIIGLNATKAYSKAYPESSPEASRVSASRLMAKPHIIKEVSRLMADRSEKIELSAEQIIYDLIEIKERCMQATPCMTFDYNQKRMVETGEYQFKESGAIKALELMGKHLAMFTDKKEIELKTGEGLAERMNEAIERLKELENNKGKEDE